MQHLETTYFLNQAVWCVFMFVIMYITTRKKIINKNNEIVNRRKYILEDYIIMSNKLLAFSYKLDYKNEKLNKVKLKNIERQKKLLEIIKCNISLNNIKNRNKKMINKKSLINSIDKNQNMNKKLNELKKTIKLYLRYKKW